MFREEERYAKTRMSHFAGALAGRKNPSLEVTIEYHPGMGHVGVMGASVVREMRVLYPT